MAATVYDLYRMKSDHDMSQVKFGSNTIDNFDTDVNSLIQEAMKNPAQFQALTAYINSLIDKAKCKVLVIRKTADEFAQENPVLADGAIGFETDTQCIKLGDGKTSWKTLSYINGKNFFAVIPGSSIDLDGSQIDNEVVIDILEDK